jgi:hypothetical protein
MAFPVINDCGLLVVQPSGQVAHEDLVDTLRCLDGASVEPSPGRLLVIDSRSRYNPSNGQWNELSELFASLVHRRFKRVAFVAHTDLHYGLGRQMQVMLESEPGQFRVFRNEDDARRWLLDPEAA